MAAQQQSRTWLRILLRWTLRGGALLISLTLAAFLFFFSGALYNRFVHFPREAAAWDALRKSRNEAPSGRDTGNLP